ncbi:MAG: 16S rRNA (adenine(1518)-N(6)/adenine(1519)-N(6))-dimethyltransferase RsmA [Endomicrobiia bacterium]
MAKFDQNFLVDKNVVEKIIFSGDFSSDDIVLEIGPGRGVLTEKIAPKVGKLFVVEIDSRLTKYLHEKFVNYNNVEIINQDFLKFALNSVSLPAGKKLKIIGNIPYSITTPIIEKIFEYSMWEMAVIMMQKEVAQRILAVPGSKSFSRLTLWTNFYSKTEPLFEVKKTCFRPVPEVDSFVVKFYPNDEYKNFKYKEELFKIIALIFSQRRKTILNSLSNALKLDKELVKNYIIKSGINIDSRPETIHLVEFMKLVENISK